MGTYEALIEVLGHSQHPYARLTVPSIIQASPFLVIELYEFLYLRLKKCTFKRRVVLQEHSLLVF